jgi:hypothetical protein
VPVNDGLKIGDQPGNASNCPAIRLCKIAAGGGFSPTGHEPIGSDVIPLDPAARLERLELSPDGLARDLGDVGNTGRVRAFGDRLYIRTSNVVW